MTFPSEKPVNFPNTRMFLHGELTRIRLDVELRKLAGEKSQALVQEEMRALQIALELRELCSGRLQ